MKALLLAVLVLSEVVVAEPAKPEVRQTQETIRRAEILKEIYREPISERIDKLPYGNYERFEMYKSPKVGAYLEYRNHLVDRGELLDRMLGSQFSKGNVFGDLIAPDAKSRLGRNDDFQKLAKDERDAVTELVKKIEAFRAKMEPNSKANGADWMKNYEEIQKDMAKLAEAGDATEAFVNKYFGLAGKGIARKAGEARTVEEVVAALKQSNEWADFRDVARQVTNQRLRTQALEQAMDNTANGYYLQAKMEQLIGSQQFCDAAKACAAGPDGKPKSPKLDGLFERKTHK